MRFDSFRLGDDAASYMSEGRPPDCIGKMADWVESQVDFPNSAWFNGKSCSGSYADWERVSLITSTSTTEDYYHYDEECTVLDQDGRSCIVMVGLGDGNDILGYTRRWWDEQDGANYLVEADVGLNSSTSWRAYGDCSGVWDIENVVAHELGHAMGLEHTTNACAVMYGNHGSPKLFNTKTLTCHDHARAAVLYPLEKCGGGYPCNCMMSQGTQVQGVVCVE